MCPSTATLRGARWPISTNRNTSIHTHTHTQTHTNKERERESLRERDGTIRVPKGKRKIKNNQNSRHQCCPIAAVPCRPLLVAAAPAGSSRCQSLTVLTSSRTHTHGATAVTYVMYVYIHVRTKKQDNIGTSMKHNLPAVHTCMYCADICAASAAAKAVSWSNR